MSTTRYGLRSVIHLLPTAIRMLLVYYLRYHFTFYTYDFTLHFLVYSSTLTTVSAALRVFLISPRNHLRTSNPTPYLTPR